jgi:hypothetical protein
VVSVGVVPVGVVSVGVVPVPVDVVPVSVGTDGVVPVVVVSVGSVVVDEATHPADHSAAPVSQFFPEARRSSSSFFDPLGSYVNGGMTSLLSSAA